MIDANEVGYSWAMEDDNCPSGVTELFHQIFITCRRGPIQQDNRVYSLQQTSIALGTALNGNRCTSLCLQYNSLNSYPYYYRSLDHASYSKSAITKTNKDNLLQPKFMINNYFQQVLLPFCRAAGKRETHYTSIVNSQN